MLGLPPEMIAKNRPRKTKKTAVSKSPDRSQNRDRESKREAHADGDAQPH